MKPVTASVEITVSRATLRDSGFQATSFDGRCFATCPSADASGLHALSPAKLKRDRQRGRYFRRRLSAADHPQQSEQNDSSQNRSEEGKPPTPARGIHDKAE